jgi:cob(I)alamin adenosyltransferase
MKGYIQVYTGDGKGKTTAALGLALRAAGNGMKSYIGQFMKGTRYGEVEYLKKIKEIDVEQFGWEDCIRKEDVTEFHKERTSEGLKTAYEIVSSKKYDIVILDEILVAIWFGLIEESKVVEFLNWHPRDSELILTGRKASAEIIEISDLTTEMKCVKHYYDKGVMSRKGIEI